VEDDGDFCERLESLDEELERIGENVGKILDRTKVQTVSGK